MSRVSILQSPLAITSLGIAALVTVGACVPTSMSSSGGSGQVAAMCWLTIPPRSSATPPPMSAASAVANATGMVGVILPGATSSTRYMPYDAPPWQKAFHATGVQVSDDDRVTLGGSGSPYVSFDRVEVGTQQGRTLVDCVKQSNVTNPP